jgi:mono/diheme cytochrome c family protein
VVPAGNLSGTVTLTANQTNLVVISKVQFFLNGTTKIGEATASPFTAQWDTTTVANGSAKLRAIATDANGNVGSTAILTVTVANTAPATTLTQVQTNVFTPKCSGCHNGSNPAGGALPGSMDLRSGNAFASIVNVASLEQGTLMRVKPSDPDNSYLIHKVENTPGISGAQMPFGGPFLDQPTIDTIRSWITAGALNN